MADKEFDPYAGTTGLKEDFDGTIVSCAFYKEPERDNFTAQIDVKADDGDDVELRYGLGGDWASYDGGETVEHLRSAQFNVKSAYFDFVNHAVKLSKESEAEIRTRGKLKKDDQGRDMGPRDASTWLNLRFHFDVFQIPGQRKDKESGEWTSKNADGTEILYPRTLPTAWLGIAPIQGDLWQPAPAPSAAPSAAPVTTNLGLSSSDWTKLTLLAKSSDYSSFIDSVMGLQAENGTDMLSNRELIAKLSDETFYNELKAS